jgi:hypothetical protein
MQRVGFIVELSSRGATAAPPATGIRCAGDRTTSSLLLLLTSPWA